MTREVVLREVRDEDLSVFFAYQRDPEANHQAAFTARDPEDRAAFMEHWAKIRRDDAITIRTILCGPVVGHVAAFKQTGNMEITYWIGREFWGRGIATRALELFLSEYPVRPLHARAATDNTASLRVLEKCGFVVTGSDRGFALGRGEEVDEVVLMLA